MLNRDEIYDFLKDEGSGAVEVKELVRIFDIDTEDMAEFYDYIEDLLESGKVMKTKKNKLIHPIKMGFYTGKLMTHQKGFGFVRLEEEGEEDIFIPPSKMAGALNNDIVLVKLVRKATETQKNEGEIVDVITRANSEVIGVYQQSQSFGFVVIDDKKFNKDVFIPKKFSGSAKDGDIVIVEIIKWPKEGRKPEGRILEVLGKKGDPGIDIISIIRKHKLPEAFSTKILREAEKVPQDISRKEIEGRRDLTKEMIITIDGADAKDLDDAVSVKKLDNGNFLLGVYIADVTHYVTEGSKLDKEALKRGTSVYLVDRVIPMLPKRLSNGICSLNPHVDRLTLSIEMEIDPKGKVVDHNIFEAVINSKERMTYTDVSDILEGVEDDRLKKYDYIKDLFKNMEELALILRKYREDRGSIDFNFAEAKILVDENGEVTDIVKAERRIANRIIEEFMLKANETIAENFYWLNIPFVYRIHENPDDEKIETFNKFLYNFGYRIKGDANGVHPKAIQEILDAVTGKKEEHIISKLMLRSLKQAKYSPENSGHFGLSAQYYSHFTSPIRRYPDLQIHRIIKEFLAGNIDEARSKALEAIVVYAAEQSSERERIAEDAERETDDLKMTEYMGNFIGEQFSGIISSVTKFGMFVELPNTVEGLIRVMDMDDDYYIYDEENLRFIGERHRKIYSIGDPVEIVVKGIDIDNREIDFALVE
ncbi:MAG: ribonuclease R [Firmicutes bacterium]|jgi:ribonuclease R|nr:ribonuclease R [Bacillota bacterium]